MKVAFAQINPTVADLKGNQKKIVDLIKTSQKKGAHLVVFPELAITGYPPEDFLLLPHFLEAVEQSLREIAPLTRNLVVLIGTPRREGNHLYNSVAIFENGSLTGYYDKQLLPTYDVFNERRYFTPGSSPAKLLSLQGKTLALTICEDIWKHSVPITPDYSFDPILALTSSPIDLLVNLSASPFSLTKPKKRIEIGKRVAETLKAQVLLCNQVGGNDSLIFDGHSFLLSKRGELVALAKGFEEDLLLVNLDQAHPPISYATPPEEELYRALLLGLKDYCRKTHFNQVCLGLSGGVDSALVAVLAVDALGKENVHAVLLPSRYTSPESRRDAQELARRLGIDTLELSIEPAYEACLKTLQPAFGKAPPDVTEENLQSRLRGVLLMSLSNKKGWLVLSTGNKSELGTGYTTLYGDMVGGLAVISDITKQQVYQLSHWINRNKEIIPASILSRAPSAELRPNQKDSDTLPPYNLLDLVLDDYVLRHLSPEEIADVHSLPLPLVQDLIRRIHRSEYKRRQAPPGLKVSERAFSIGRRFPIVQGWI